MSGFSSLLRSQDGVLLHHRNAIRVVLRLLLSFSVRSIKGLQPSELLVHGAVDDGVLTKAEACPVCLSVQFPGFVLRT